MSRPRSPSEVDPIAGDPDPAPATGMNDYVGIGAFALGLLFLGFLLGWDVLAGLASFLGLR